jgi:hypothetical protein
MQVSGSLYGLIAESVKEVLRSILCIAAKSGWSMGRTFVVDRRYTTISASGRALLERKGVQEAFGTPDFGLDATLGPPG